jgi:branched-subunit amino acid transport protein
MNTVTIAVVAATVFSARLGGLLLARRWPDGTASQSLRFAPISVLSAICVLLVSEETTHQWWTLIPLLSGGVAVRLTERLWSGIAVGLLSYWLTGFIVESL